MKNSQSLFASMATILTAVMLAACSASVDAGPITPPPFGPQGGFKISDANGTWKTGCTLEGNFGSISTLTLSDGSFTSENKVFNSSICDPSTLVMEKTFLGTVSLISESASEPGSYNVDVITQDAEVDSYSNIVRIEGNEMYFGASKNLGTYPVQTDRNQKYIKQ